MLCLLREAIETGSEYGRKAKEYMDRGDLVPDDIVNEIVRERLSQPDALNGFILDGFPRDLEQANALEKVRGIDYVFDIRVPDEDIILRLGKRRTCEKCQAIYHLENKPPEKPDECDNCGGKLLIREDDKPETIKHRLEVYHKQTEPLIEYYNNENLLVAVDGMAGVEKTYETIKNRLDLP